MSPRHWKLLAIAAGVLFAGAPTAAFNYWLNGLIERQGQNEVELSARRSITLAESRIVRVIAALDDLGMRDVDSCGPEQIDTLRRVAFSVTPVKELSVVSVAGETLCTDIGVTWGRREIVSSQTISSAGDLFFEVVQVGDRAERMVRVRRQSAGLPGVAALVPADLFIAQVSTQGATLSSHTRMMTRDGTMVGEAGILVDPETAGGAFVATRASDRYGLQVNVVLPRSGVAVGSVNLRELGFVVTAGAALVIIAFGLLVPWRGRDNNPITQIEKAIRAGEFVPYYQPIIDIKTGRLCGAEVLIRWRKRDGTLVSPTAFIPLAESSGLILPITRNLMRQVRDELGEAYRRRPLLRVSFNLAAAHFIDDDIVGDVRKIFENSAIRLPQVVLELTERQQLANLTAARRVIAALQGLGVKVAIDDVGAGHSGLSYMLKLGVDVIKVDKIFIDALGSDRDSIRIIDTLVDLAASMRMEIVAEGVETFDQMVALREHGIRQAQGHLFAPALPGSSFLKLIEAIEPLGRPAVAAVA